MPLLEILAAGAALTAIGLASPKLANALAYLLTMGITLPIITVAVGSVTWAGLMAAGILPCSFASYLITLLVVGLPAGCLMSWFALKE